MLRKGTLTVLPGFIFLSLLSFVACDESLFLHDIDYGVFLPSTSTLKEKCLNYPNLPQCLNWKFLQEELDFRNDVLAPEMNKENNNTSLEDNEKEGIMIDIPFASPEKPLDKRFAVFRRRNPNAQGYKRGPGFRSWGGKRDPFYSNQILEKKSKFTSWGGKRDCYAWGDSNESETNGLQEKRTKFGNWGGKRDGDLQDKRSKFLSWGGKKRSEAAKRHGEDPISYDQMEKRGPFWKFKAYLHEPFKKQVPKRPQFQSWGGKRTLPHWDISPEFYYYRHPAAGFDFRKLFTGEGKRTFSSWGGKRNDGEPEKRSDPAANLWEGRTSKNVKTRQVFQNWGGKRTEDSQEGSDIGEIFTKPDELSTVEEKPSNRRKREILKNDKEIFPSKDFDSWDGKREKAKFTR